MLVEILCDVVAYRPEIARRYGRQPDLYLELSALVERHLRVDIATFIKDPFGTLSFASFDTFSSANPFFFSFSFFGGETLSYFLFSSPLWRFGRHHG